MTCDIWSLSNEETLDMTHVVLQLTFDNTAYQDDDSAIETELDNLSVSSEVFFDVFPFHIGSTVSQWIVLITLCSKQTWSRIF